MGPVDHIIAVRETVRWETSGLCTKKNRLFIPLPQIWLLFLLNTHSCHMEEEWVYSVLKLRPSSFSPCNRYYVHIHVQNKPELLTIHPQRLAALFHVPYLNKSCKDKLKRKPLAYYFPLFGFFLFVYTLTHIVNIKRLLNNSTPVKIWRSNS